MRNQGSSKLKENEVKFIKKAAPNKAKLSVRKEDGKKVNIERTMTGGCVPTGHD